MSRRQIIFIIILTVTFAVSLSVLVVKIINDVNILMENECFEKLEEISKFLATEIKRAADSDRTILTAMAAIISGMENPSDEKLCEVLNTYSFDASYISFTELLRPDNTMLYADGFVQDVSGMLNFEEEVKAGAHIFTSKMERVARQVESHNYYISYGIAHRENGIGADSIAQEADEKMLENKREFYIKHNRRRPREDA